MSINVNARNIFLTGMPGVGKSTAGQIAARTLGCDFVDTDQTIEKNERLSIARIFSEKGESYFRQRERELLEKLCHRDHQLIATGGGMLVPSANLALAQQHGLVILLVADVEELARRLALATDRPLLAAGDVTRRLDELSRERAAAYACITTRVDTKGQTAAIVAAQIVELYHRWTSAHAH